MQNKKNMELKWTNGTTKQRNISGRRPAMLAPGGQEEHQRWLMQKWNNNNNNNNNKQQTRQLEQQNNYGNKVDKWRKKQQRWNMEH